MLKRILVATIISVSLFLYSCGSGKEISRIDPQQTTDLSGNWNDTDSRLVAEEMVKDALSRPWLTQFTEQNKEKPVVVVGKVRNKSSEHITVETFLKDIERELLNSGTVNFVADAGQREEVRAERKDQNDFASKETFKKFYQEIGADFLLTGEINSIIDQEGGTTAKYYTIDLELINIETNLKVWIGNKKIKKLIERDNYSM